MDNFHDLYKVDWKAFASRIHNLGILGLAIFANYIGSYFGYQKDKA